MKFTLCLPELPWPKINTGKSQNESSAVSCSSEEEVLGVFPWQ